MAQATFLKLRSISGVNFEDFGRMKEMKKIGLGGGCHWCTEAVFQSLKGVSEVEQGYIASNEEASSFSEAVIVTYDPEVIPLKILIEIHLYTHRSTSNHSFREKYRSAVYFFNFQDAEVLNVIFENLRKDFEEEIVTEILPFRKFKPSRDSLQDYYLKNPEKPFCRTYIHPKLDLLKKRFANNMLLPN